MIHLRMRHLAPAFLVLLGCDPQVDPKLKITSGKDVIAVQRFRVTCDGHRAIVRVDPEWLKFEKHGVGSGAVTSTLATLGLLGDLLVTGRTGKFRPDNMVAGASVVPSGAANKISKQFTLAAGKLLERLKPQLRKEAPLIDWDSMFCKASGEPALPRPLNK